MARSPCRVSPDTASDIRTTRCLVSGVAAPVVLLHPRRSRPAVVTGSILSPEALYAPAVPGRTAASNAFGSVGSRDLLSQFRLYTHHSLIGAGRLERGPDQQEFGTVKHLSFRFCASRPVPGFAVRQGGGTGQGLVVGIRRMPVCQRPSLQTAVQDTCRTATNSQGTPGTQC